MHPSVKKIFMEDKNILIPEILWKKNFNPEILVHSKPNPWPRCKNLIRKKPGPKPRNVKTSKKLNKIPPELQPFLTDRSRRAHKAPERFGNSIIYTNYEKWLFQDVPLHVTNTNDTEKRLTFFNKSHNRPSRNFIKPKSETKIDKQVPSRVQYSEDVWNTFFNSHINKIDIRENKPISTISENPKVVHKENMWETFFSSHIDNISETIRDTANTRDNFDLKTSVKNTNVTDNDTTDISTNICSDSKESVESINITDTIHNDTTDTSTNICDNSDLEESVETNDLSVFMSLSTEKRVFLCKFCNQVFDYEKCKKIHEFYVHEHPVPKGNGNKLSQRKRRKSVF